MKSNECAGQMPWSGSVCYTGLKIWAQSGHGSQHGCKKAGMMTHSYNPSLGEVEIEEFLELFEQTNLA